MARNNEVLGVGQTDANGFVHFAAGLARGEGGLAPAAIVASAKGSGGLFGGAVNEDYAFLSLKSSAFDLSDRGVGGREVPVGLDAFVYTERGVYRTGETVHVTSLLRDARGIAAPSVPLTLVVERPDGVEYRRALLQDGGIGGRSLDVPIVSSAMSGTWRVAAYTDPKRPPVGETTFMVEDYVPDRIEFDLTSESKSISPAAPAQVTVDGRFLYGAPASNLELSGSVIIAAAKERPGFPGYVFGLSDEGVVAQRLELVDMPTTGATGKVTFPIELDKLAATTRPLEARITVSMAESGGRAVERKLTLPVTPDATMIGVKPAFSGRALADGANADFDVVMLAPDGSKQAAKDLHYELLKVTTTYQWYRQNGQWQYEPIKRTERVTDGKLDIAADKPARLSLPVKWGRYRLEVAGGDIVTSLPFDAGFYAEIPRGHARSLGSRARQERLQVRRDDERGSDRAQRRPPHAQCVHRSSGGDAIARRQSGRREAEHRRRQGLGHRRLSGCDLAAAARPAGAAHARQSDRRAMVRHRPRRAHAAGCDDAAGDAAAEFQARRAVEARWSCRGRRSARGGGRRRCRHSQSHQLQAAGARRLLSRPAPAHRRDPRSLRATDRRHARRHRPDPHRRRCRRRADRLAADAGAARALFRHRQGRRRRQRDGELRYSGFRRHRARDGGGLDERQSRQGDRRRDRARSGRADRHVAALPAHRRQGRRAARARQCRGRGRRLRDHGGRRRRRQDRGRQADAQARRQAARPRLAAGDGIGCGRKHRRRECHGAERLYAGARLCAQCAAGDADARAAERAADRRR